MNIDEYIKELGNKITKPVVIFDVETTGVDPKKDEIVQFAGIRVEPGGKTKQLTFVCKPSLPIGKEAAEIHGITNEMVKDKPVFKKLSKEIAALFKNADIAGFNLASFDVKFIERQMASSGYKDIFKDAHIYDAYKIFVKHCTRKLGDAMKFYVGSDIENAHDALADVEATVAVMAKQIEVENIPFTEIAIKSTGRPDERFSLGKYIVFNDKKEPVLNFSTKNKGKLLKDVDKGFLSWIINNDFPKELKDFVKKYL